MYDGSKKERVDAPELRCVSDAARAAELEAVPTTIHLIGTLPGIVTSANTWLGRYDVSLTIVNGYSHYVKHGDDQRSIWCTGTGYWHAGHTKHLGSGSIRALEVKLQAPSPASPDARWKARVGLEAVAAPALRCLSDDAWRAEQLEQIVALADQALKDAIAADDLARHTMDQLRSNPKRLLFTAAPSCLAWYASTHTLMGGPLARSCVCVCVCHQSARRT